MFPGSTRVAGEILASLMFVPGYEIFGGGFSAPDKIRFPYQGYFILPDVADPKFGGALRLVVDQNQIDAIIPANDIAVLRLAELSASHPVVTHPLSTAEFCYNKRLFHEHIQDSGLMPQRFPFLPGDENYPIFVRNVVGHSSIGAFRVDSSVEGNRLLNSGRIDPERQILTSFLPGDEVTVDCFTSRERELLLVAPRLREQTVSGMSSKTSDYESPQLLEIATTVNQLLVFRGPWFFQAKQDGDGIFRVLEVGARVAGASGIRRAQGINLSHLGILDWLGEPLEIPPPLHCMTYHPFLEKVELSGGLAFCSLYVDFDDTLLLGRRVNEILARFITRASGQGKRIILISRHRGNLSAKLRRYKFEGLFDEVIHIRDGQSKETFIKSEGGALFIDDSFSERRALMFRKDVLAVDASAVPLLLNFLT